MKCIGDGGTCSTGGYCAECPWKRIAELEKENERLLTLATKWCDKSHHDWQEILKIAKEG